MEEEKKVTGLVMTGAVVGAVTASLCCILPVVAAGLGVAGFAASEFFGRWRPYLLAVTLGLLALGFYLAYRPTRQEACEPGTLCKRIPFARWNRAILWLVTVLAILLTAFPYYSGWVVQAVTRTQPPVRGVPQSAGAHVVLKIEDMTCPACATGLQNNLSQIPGVRRAEVSFQDKQASLDYDPRAVDPSRFAKAITDAGFKVVPAPVASN